MIPDHPPDVPAYEDDSPIKVGFNQERCELCGITSNPPRKAVADFPDPTGGSDPRGRLICIDCYVDELQDVTPLSETKSKIFALMMAGYNHDQISRTIGRSKTKVERWTKDIRDQRQGRGHDTLERLYQYI